MHKLIMPGTGKIYTFSYRFLEKFMVCSGKPRPPAGPAKLTAGRGVIPGWAGESFQSVFPSAGLGFVAPGGLGIQGDRPVSGQTWFPIRETCFGPYQLAGLSGRGRRQYRPTG